MPEAIFEHRDILQSRAFYFLGVFVGAGVFVGVTGPGVLVGGLFPFLVGVKVGVTVSIVGVMVIVGVKVGEGLGVTVGGTT